MRLSEIQNKGLVWINVPKREENVLRAIQRRFNFHDQEIQECLPKIQRTKFVKRDGYYFVVLHFPVFNKKTKRLGFTEIDFFISGSTLITVHDNSLPIVDIFYKECAKNSGLRERFFQGTATHLLLELLRRLLDSVFPILLHVSEDIDAVDKKMFAEISGRVMAEEILRLKTNVVNFRKTMQGHKTVLEKLVTHGGRELDISSYQNYVNTLREYTNEIWHTLESQKESVNALHETNESLVGLRTNEVMRFLTVISVVTFPLTLLATLFAIRAPGNPLINQPFGFWAILIIIIFGAVLMTAVFKKKKWL